MKEVGILQQLGNDDANQSAIAPATPASLDPEDWAGFRAQAHRMLDDMLGHLENIRERPVWQIIPDEVRARFTSPLPTQPAALADVHNEFMTSILPFTAANTHPGFLGWAQGGGTPVGMLAEMLASGLNANVGGRDQIPVDVEKQVTDWMRTLFGFPPGASGIFLTGTSMANFVAFVTARNVLSECRIRREGVQSQLERLTAYASVAAHGSIAKALDLAGLGSDALRLIAIDDHGRIDLDSLAQAIADDRAAGFTPFFVVGSAGTVDIGAIDDLIGLGDLCDREALWFHVDGALGALAMLSPQLAPRLRGIERADSLAFDFHKWGQVPYDAGFLLVRDGALHHKAFASSCAYLAREERGLSAGSSWPCDLGPELSRSFRALKVWTTLKVYGSDAIGSVIANTCELAQYLQRRIEASPELELMAPVALNIVCFRYRFPSAETSDRLNRELIIRLQESGIAVPSQTMLQNRVAIRAAIVNHRTTQADLDALVDAALSIGRELTPMPAPAPLNPHHPEISMEHEERLQELNAQLSTYPQKELEVELRVERAGLLAQLGRDLEARSDYLRVLELEPAHRTNLLDLGRLLITTGHLKAAQVVYAEAVKQYPDDVVFRINLGSAYLQGDALERAREQYEAALHLDPHRPQAHGGMYYALSRLGEEAAAALHQQKAFGSANVFQSPYRGSAPPIPVVLLVSSTGGNTPVEKLLDETVFQTYVVVADFYDPSTPLPEHRLIFNGIGDVDVSQHSLRSAQSLLARNSSPVLNMPKAVLATSRCENASRFAHLPGVRSARTLLYSHASLSGPDGAGMLQRDGFHFPLLLRAPGFHMGQHFVQVNSPAELSTQVALMPGAGRSSSQILVIEYLDARGQDGCARKYRVMIVDGKLYPLHLAISPNWKIHYFSADMADRPDHRAEEEQFLTDMPTVLGSRAMAALEAIRTMLDLDYGGIDFGLNLQGEVLLFEANATMVVEQPAPDPRWDYRRTAVDAIHAAVRTMLLQSASPACST